MVHDPVRVCSISGHHHDPELPHDHLHLGATQSEESFHNGPTQDLPPSANPSPCRESQAMVWMDIQSEFETIWTVFGRNLDLSRSDEWSAVDEIRRGLNPMNRC